MLLAAEISADLKRLFSGLRAKTPFIKSATLDLISQRRKTRSKMNFHAHKSFDSQKNISLPFTPRPNKSPKKISLKIGYKIPWTYMLLILKFFDPHQKSYGFKRISLNGVFVRRPEKSRFKSVKISAASNLAVGSY